MKSTFFTTLLVLLIAAVSGFAPSTNPAFSSSRPPTTQLEAAPTMVVYWSIKSAIDLVGYATGKSDKFKGTGVFSAIEFEREKKEDGKKPLPAERKKEDTSSSN